MKMEQLRGTDRRYETGTGRVRGNEGTTFDFEGQRERGRERDVLFLTSFLLLVWSMGNRVSVCECVFVCVCGLMLVITKHDVVAL